VTDKDFDYEILLTDEGRETIQKRYEARLAGKDISPQYELKIRNKKGHFVNIEVTTVSIARPGDVYVLGIMRDISDRIKAEKALAQTNELFRIAFTTSPDAISISDLETGEYVDVNEGYAHLTGYSKDEIIGKGSLEINIWNNPADREKVVDILQKEGKIVNYQAEFRLKSGAVRHGLMSANLVEIDGRPHLLTITRDITDNVRAEKQLRQSEERFRLITNNMNDIVCLHAPHGEYVYISPSIEDVLGYLPMELIGTNPLDLVHPEDINDNLIAHYKEISRTSGKIRGEYRMKNKSGDYVWVESISQIIRRPDGEIDHLVSSTRDISDRIESERLLQYSEEQYRLLFEKILNGYVIYNILYDDEGEPYDYRFIKVNHAFEEITGLSAENVIGRTVLEVVPNLGDQWERVYYEIATHGDPIRTELYSPNFDRYYEIVGFMTREGQLAMVFSDISDRKEYEQRMESINKELEHRVAERTKQVEDTLLELENENEERRKAQEQLIRLNEELEKSRSALIEEANKLIEINQRLKDSEQTLKEANATKDKFFSIIAHDLKNPLQALILTANVLLKSHHMMDDDELDNKIFRVYHTSRIFGNLLDNLLQWARSQTGRIEFMPEIIDLEDVFSRNHSVVSQLAERKQIHISLRNIGSTNVFADFNLLNTILRNLLTNAIKFTNEKGRVLLLSRENVNGIEISVTDNGCGLDEETIKKLFGGMSHYTTPGTNDEKGTGLGLVLCREFVEMHGGELHVKSTLGEGSKFYFQLPKAHDK
jgi:PAS domain S-box-containing protein